MINYSIADRKYTQSSHVQHIGLFLGVKRHSLIEIIFKSKLKLWGTKDSTMRAKLSI